MHGSRVKLNEEPPIIPLLNLNDERLLLIDILK